MAKGDDIENRLVDFAVRIVHLSDNMPNKRSANHIAGQLLRSGTAPAALYAEARGAESPKDFQNISQKSNPNRMIRQLHHSLFIIHDSLFSAYRQLFVDVGA
jgi:four helix bundle protein